MTISTVSDLNSLYNLIYEDSLLTLREENVIVSNGLVRRYNATGFAARKIGQWSSATVQTKPEGVDFASPSDFQKTLAATLTPATKMAQFILTDEMIATESTEDVTEQARMELGAAIAEQIDEDMVDNFPNFSTGKGSAGSALTLGIVGAAMAVLTKNKIKGSMSVVLHPYGWHDIWTALGNPAATYDFLGDTANEALRRYFVSNLQGATWVTNANIDIDSETDAVGAVFAREALGYDQREAYGVEVERDASRKAYEYDASISYAHGIIRNSAGVKLTHDATEPTT